MRWEGESQRGVRGLCTTVYRIKVNVTLFASVLRGHESSGYLVKCEPETKRTILPETVVANSHRILTINKVYFLTCT